MQASIVKLMFKYSVTLRRLDSRENASNINMTVGVITDQSEVTKRVTFTNKRLESTMAFYSTSHELKRLLHAQFNPRCNHIMGADWKLRAMKTLNKQFLITMLGKQACMLYCLIVMKSVEGREEDGY